MNVEGLWPMYVWAAAVAAAIVAGIWSATNNHDLRLSVPHEHIAGAALVGLFGWEMLISLPGSVSGYLQLTAGLGDLRGVQAQQAFLAAQAAFAVGAGFAVMGILRRRTWGSVLGIGLALTLVVSSTLNLANITATMAESMSADAYWSTVASLIGMQAIPALAAAALLLWPLLRPAARQLESPAG
jgi:hypothetical protein